MTLTRTLRYMTVLGSAVLAMAPLAAQAAHTAAASGEMPVFGSVDINKLQTQSTKKAKYDTDLHALAERLNAAFKLQASSIMLSKAEQVELGGLLSKVNPTDADRNRSNALQAQASKAAQQLTDLQQKKDPTPADTALVASLTSQYETGKAALQEVGDGYQEQLKTLSDKDNADFTQSVKDAITAVAQQRGLSVVFTSDIAVYTVNDITDDVVKRINK
jgi:Skp family chaperone for outer membrane proteins